MVPIAIILISVFGSLAGLGTCIHFYQKYNERQYFLVQNSLIEEEEPVIV